MKELKKYRCVEINTRTNKTCNEVLFKYEGEITTSIQIKCNNCKKIIEIKPK